MNSDKNQSNKWRLLGNYPAAKAQLELQEWREDLTRVQEALQWTDHQHHEEFQSNWKEPTYQELLDRLYSNCNDDISTKKIFKINPPVIFREGKKKVVFVNFTEMVNTMNRSPDHFLSYILAELSTSGSTDAEGRAIIKYTNRQAQKHMETVIKNYIKEYVLCNVCKSSETNLNRDSANRLDIKLCRLCGASKCVKPIKSGFQAQIGKRKKN